MYILSKLQLTRAMDVKDTMVTDIVILALKMNDTIKRQEIMIEQLKSDKNELQLVISKMKALLGKYSPYSINQFELFNLLADK